MLQDTDSSCAPYCDLPARVRALRIGRTYVTVLTVNRLAERDEEIHSKRARGGLRLDPMP